MNFLTGASLLALAKSIYYFVFKRRRGSQAVNSSDFKSVGPGLNPGFKKLFLLCFTLPICKKGYR